MIRRLLAVAFVLASVSVVACGGDDESVVFGASGAWTRPTPAAATNGVLYLTISSDTDDELVAVDVPAAIAAEAQLHETMTMDGGGGHSGHGGSDGGEVMSMGEVDAIEVDGGSSVTFEPGGNHIMLIDLAAPLAAGDTYVATLRFASGRTLDVDVVVADNPPG